MEALAVLKRHEVFIGIPENTTRRKDKKETSVNNAELLFIHTNGSPANHIPPRPVLDPAIKHNKDRVAANIKNAIDTALDGNAAGVLPALEAAGLDGQNIARDWFTDSANKWPDNADATKKRKGSVNPLIDTGEMRKAITYVVREV